MNDKNGSNDKQKSFTESTNIESTKLDSINATESSADSIKSQMEDKIRLLVGVCALALWLYDVELYGDVFRYMPLAFGVAWLVQRRYTPLLYLVITSIVVLGVAYAIKLACVYVANYYAHIVDIELLATFAQRPINGAFNGFPSGHTTSAFIASAFAFRYVSVKWGLFTFVLAALVACARVMGDWHTIIQVVFGGIWGFVGSYCMISLCMWIDKKRQKRL
ncbi:phosphatase PAP2 family protein [Helicobacter jaachi]|nr:phosphatase PAP2 family protein [Helicobacter jaachi]